MHDDDILVFLDDEVDCNDDDLTEQLKIEIYEVHVFYELNYNEHEQLLVVEVIVVMLLELDDDITDDDIVNEIDDLVDDEVDIEIQVLYLL